jgi:periplasmic glucans biosynthesis protein
MNVEITINRAAAPRRFSWTRIALLGWLGLPCANAAAFDFADVAQRAKALANAAYKPASVDIPKELKALSYEQYRDIRFRPDKAHWRAAGLPFELGFFHPGYFYQQPVKINEVGADGVREIAFDPKLFHYGKTNIDSSKIPNIGFAGFRVHYPINNAKYKDEVLVFLGASYFRALGKGQLYGLSARGLAIDTGLSSGEEFPHFVEFWIERPAHDAQALTVYALLDSPRATGAYRFVVKPGTDTVMDVKAQLYTRTAVDKLGIAPLTSMFFFGENQRSTRDDYRPEVHDSDGLSIQASTGEWIWRPLVNPKRLLVTSFAARNPAGFGLMQRDREFMHYEDLEARMELRPSAWVEPKGQWGAGRVELVQIPTPDETNDNIVAYWVPDTVPPPKQAFDIEYRVRWQKSPQARPPTAWVSQTRRGQAFAPKPADGLAFTVEFDGPALRKLPADAKLESIASTDANGQLLENTLYRNDVTGAWRVVLRVRRNDASKPVELRTQLIRGTNDISSEIWSYIIPPE